MIRVLSLLFHDVYERNPGESGFRGPAADRYKLTVEELETQLAGLAGARWDSPVLVADWPPRIGHADAFAITVDDGGISYYTRVADRLEALGWRGHCFITTAWIGRPGFLDRRQIRELDARGHLIGSHSVSHPRRFGACGWDRMVSEWADSRAMLSDIVGRDITVASVPGGHFSSQVARAARAAGLRVLFTSEPETRVRSIAECMVLGRFAVRRPCPANFSRSLAMLEWSTLSREWIVWNLKQLSKGIVWATAPSLLEERPARPVIAKIVRFFTGVSHAPARGRPATQGAGR